ncbi:MAG: hypothetical protein E6G53_00385 [Actinobacteria bacterium]|nr:MAG: hypothetical protein E6G53_00385 [Actinomycetota bacterium]
MRSVPAAAYLSEMREAFSRALKAADTPAEATLRIDDVAIRLALAGSQIASAVLPALAPVLLEAGAAPAFTVDVWDTATSGVPAPRMPWGADAAARQGVVRGYSEGSHRTVVDHGSGTVTVADLSEGRAVVYARSADEIPAWWRAVPLRLALGWAVARPDRQLVHAGAVGEDGRGVLLGGPAGAGKSTVALACVDAGMAFASDDYVLLTQGPPADARTVYGTAKLDHRSLGALPELAKRVDPPSSPDDKAIVDVHALRPDRVASVLRVSAVVIPSVTGETRTHLQRVSAAEAVRALAPSTIFQAPDASAESLRLISAVAREVPAYSLLLGEDLAEVPPLIRSVVGSDG